MAVEIYPVVHLRDPAQGADQSTLALEAGADGVYLIDHGSRYEDALLTTLGIVKGENVDAFVGVNFLGGSAAQNFLELADAIDHGQVAPDALWVDDALPMWESVRRARNSHPLLKHVSYLGGVAFKYTDSYTEHPIEAAFIARLFAPGIDVVTTSGPGTGHAAPTSKLRAMKEAIGSKRLAVASGVDIDNIHSITPIVDQILVSTSIEKRHGVFHETKLRELIEAAHEA